MNPRWLPPLLMMLLLWAGAERGAVAAENDPAPTEDPTAAEAGTPDGPAGVAEVHTVLISVLSAVNIQGFGLSLKLPHLLSPVMSQWGELRVIHPSQVPPLENRTAAEFMDDCPEEWYHECSVELGEHVGARYVVTGRVEGSEEVFLVRYRVIEVESGEPVLLRDWRYERDQDLELVARAMGQDLARELAKEPEARVHEGDGADAEPEAGPVRVVDEAEIRELDAMSETLESEMDRGERQQWTGGEERLTYEDLAEEMDSDAAKAWERLDMDPSEYLRYRNSGLSLLEWRRRERGRKGQLLVRAGGGFLQGPLDGAYYAAYVLSGENLQLGEVYGYQAMVDSPGMGLGVGVGYGLTPSLEVNGGYHTTWGSFDVQIVQQVGDEAPEEEDSSRYAHGSHLVHGGLRLVPLPGGNFRPLVEAGLVGWWSPGVENHVAIDAFVYALPQFGGHLLVGPRLAMGGELRVSDTLDLWLRAPVDLLVFGSGAEIHDEGGDDLSSKPEPVDLNGVTFGLELGLQGRLSLADAAHEGPMEP